MAEITTGLPEGTYDLKIGQSFSKSSKNRPEYHTLRYDFKPKSVSAEPETYISISSNDDVQIAFANEDTDKVTMYRGSSKPIKDGKECLLIFDEELGEMRLEKIVSNLNVKQTRGTDLELENLWRKEIGNIRKVKKINRKPKPTSPEKRHEKSSDEEGEITTSSDEAPKDRQEPKKKQQHRKTKAPVQSDWSDDDDMEAALERHLNSPLVPPNATATSSQPASRPHSQPLLKPSPPDLMDMPDFGSSPSVRLQPPALSRSSSSTPARQPPTARSTARVRTADGLELLADDLELSESSDDD